jgi:hypothetical protein
MSIYRVNKILYRLELEEDFSKSVRADPVAALAEIDLTDEERAALLSGDVGKLYVMGVHAFLLQTLARQGLFGLDRETYLQRVRAAAAQAERERGPSDGAEDDDSR